MWWQRWRACWRWWCVRDSGVTVVVGLVSVFMEMPIDNLTEMKNSTGRMSWSCFFQCLSHLCGETHPMASRWQPIDSQSAILDESLVTFWMAKRFMNTIGNISRDRHWLRSISSIVDSLRSLATFKSCSCKWIVWSPWGNIGSIEWNFHSSLQQTLSSH